MKIKKIFGCLFAFTFILSLTPVASAHTTSQEGILAKSYHSKYGGYYIGGEDVGWSIDEGAHTNGTTVTYSFDSSDIYLTDTYKAYVTSGASKWSGTVTFINKTDGTGTGSIRTFPDPNTDVVALFSDYKTDSSGHLTYWRIELNRYKPQSATVLAHELGHAIGLNDLYAEKNSGKLMYGSVSGMGTSPTSSDKWGAKVITGVHSSHTWAYKFYGTNLKGNMHVKYCTDCGGLSVVTELCTYNSNKICTKCGVPYGTSPY